MLNEQEINQQVIDELDGRMLDLYSDVEFKTDVIKDGYNCFYPTSIQIAKHITNRNYDEFRLTYEANTVGTCVSIYYEKIIQRGGCFMPTKYAPKQCIGVLIYDIEKDRITLRKTNVKTEIHEFHADSKRNMDECFGVQYELFKYLKDNDLIQIHTIERKVRHEQRFIYTITKFKAVKTGRFLHFKGFGTQYFIPKSDFRCVEGSIVKNKKKTNKKK